MFDVDKGKPTSLLLKFKSFKGSHTGLSIASAIEESISEHAMHDKVHYIVSDNASNMKKALGCIFTPGPRGDMESWLNADNLTSDNTLAVEDSDSLFDDATLYEDMGNNERDSSEIVVGERIPCFAHSLQLTIRDGLQKCAVSRTAVAKCCKLSNLVHQSTVFKSEFETAFGSRRSIPSANDTRWNSVYRQISCVVRLDAGKLADVLKKSSSTNLILTQKETQQLRELVDILEPFSEATDLAQGSSYMTISCVVPIVLSLNCKLTDFLSSIKFQLPLVKQLHRSLYERFRGIYVQLQLPCPEGINSASLSATKELDYDSSLFTMAAAVDPEHGYRWLQMHFGSSTDKERIKNRIFGELIKTLQTYRPCVNIDSDAHPAAPTSCDEVVEPPQKKARTALFGYKRQNPNSVENSVTAESQLVKYLTLIDQDEFDTEKHTNIFSDNDYVLLRPLLCRLFSVPATSAPVERVFSQGGLIMRPPG